jgi:hypothetical protein
MELEVEPVLVEVELVLELHIELGELKLLGLCDRH